MHVGTHGDINNRSPLLSSISIGDGQEFRVVDMYATRSAVNLLVFAACLSRFGRATIGGEVLGFSHVILSTGCQVYIGSLWGVSDLGSMFWMIPFYRHLKRNLETSVVEMMRRAQLDILGMDAKKASAMPDESVKPWENRAVMEEGKSKNTVNFILDVELVVFPLRMILSELDWTSPFYWAPFTLVGYGGFRFTDGEPVD